MTLDLAPADPPPEVLAHDTRNCLAVAYGRVQFLRRCAGRGAVDPARLAAGLDEIEGCLRRLAVLIDVLEAQARPLPRPHAATADD